MVSPWTLRNLPLQVCNTLQGPPPPLPTRPWERKGPRGGCWEWKPGGQLQTAHCGQALPSGRAGWASPLPPSPTRKDNEPSTTTPPGCRQTTPPGWGPLKPWTAELLQSCLHIGGGESASVPTVASPWTLGSAAQPPVSPGFHPSIFTETQLRNTST